MKPQKALKKTEGVLGEDRGVPRAQLFNVQNWNRSLAGKSASQAARNVMRFKW